MVKTTSTYFACRQQKSAVNKDHKPVQEHKYLQIINADTNQIQLIFFFDANLQAFFLRLLSLGNLLQNLIITHL